MTLNYLLEIGLEEMPAHVVRNSVNQLATKTAQFLKEQHLSYDQIKTFATPRRLAIQVINLDARQADQTEEVKGPAKRIAVNEQGELTKAALGFVRGQGVKPEAITFKDFKGEPYVFVTKKTVGQPVAKILLEMKTIITGLTFPTRMKWGTNQFEYIRPIHWLVSLLNNEIIPLQILDVSAGRISQGHRFLGQPVSIADALDYEADLASVAVIADLDHRQKMITDQIAEIAHKNNWLVDLDADLLEEVLNLVEYPTAFAGHFDSKYLAVPEQVLITSMRDNQRYFDVRTTDGKLAPDFIGIRNGNHDFLDNVIMGNEKVLVARLEDAQFFFREDQKQSIADYVEKLKKVTFHDKIGSIYEKMQRVQVISQFLGQKFGLGKDEQADLQRASEIYKFDLVTGMVGEFPELQGTMGEIYAKIFGEKATVAQAIREHYLPNVAQGELPATKVGATLAIADKIDTILAFFAVGMIPTGSNDPYALRRQSAGIVRILIDQNWHLSLNELQQGIGQLLSDNHLTFDINWSQHRDDVRQFFLDRLRQLFAERSVDHDLIDTVVASETIDPTTVNAVADILTAHRQDEKFKPTVEALTRVVRLAQQNALKLQDIKLDQDLFENPSEEKLYQAVKTLKANFDKQTLEQNFKQLQDLSPVIDQYFEENMIMADDPRIRNNRLKQLLVLQRLIAVFGDLRELIVK